MTCTTEHRRLQPVLALARRLDVAANPEPEAIYEAGGAGFQIWCTPEDQPDGWSGVHLTSGAFSKPCGFVARVSSHDQKEDLVRQVALLKTFCAANGWSYEIVQDLGSGLNYNKKGLQQLIKRICSGTVGRLVLTHKDRLLRFGSELVFSLCEAYNTEVVIINQGEQPLSIEGEPGQDVPEIITVFSARLYGIRSHKMRNLVETLPEAAEQL